MQRGVLAAVLPDERMMKVAILVAVTAAALFVSRASLLSPRSHGFFRFFAWESILVLFLLNVDVWFHDPFSVHQLISWSLFFVSTFFLFYGVRLLQAVGKPSEHREDEYANRVL